MLNTKNLKVGELVIVQRCDCFQIGEVTSIKTDKSAFVNVTNGNDLELFTSSNIHKILNKYAFNIERKKNEKPVEVEL